MQTSINGKVGAGAVAGALSVILVWVLTTFVPGLEKVPAEIAAAFTTMLTFVVSWRVPNYTEENGATAKDTVPTEDSDTDTASHIGPMAPSPA